MPTARQNEYRLRVTGVREPVGHVATHCHLSLHASCVPHPTPPDTVADRCDLHLHHVPLVTARAITRWLAHQLGVTDLPAEKLVNYSQFVHLSLTLPRLAAMLTAAAFRGLHPSDESFDNARILATELDDDGPTCY